MDKGDRCFKPQQKISQWSPFMDACRVYVKYPLYQGPVCPASPGHAIALGALPRAYLHLIPSPNTLNYFGLDHTRSLQTTP